jgi:very-short-patch-repair endonuclease
MHFDQNMSVKAIAKKLGCSRGPVVLAIRKAGRVQRSASEATKVEMDRIGPNGRRDRTAAANRSWRGSVRPEEEVLRKVAAQAGRVGSKLEALFFEILGSQLGRVPQSNYQVGRFLIDIAYTDEKIAIEVDGGNWHTTTKKALQDVRKTAFLTSLGWRVIRFGKDDLTRCVEQVRPLLNVLR